MIEYIKGDLAECTPATAVIDRQGMGYLLNISLNTYSAIQGKSQVKLFVYEAIREDAYLLFGFFERKERDLFLMLLTVPGIGGNTARMILSALTPAELCNAIASGDERLLKTVKGIGLRTAQRIIVDLKDKIKTAGFDVNMSAGLPLAVQSKEMESAVAALVMLGFAQAPSTKVVQHIVKDEPDASVERIIKLALKQL